MNIKKIFETIIIIPSPSRQEGAMMKYLKSFISELGFGWTEDNFSVSLGGEGNNLCVDIPANGSGHNILLCAHVDTVERGDKPIYFVCENGEYQSRGDTILGADDKTGVACLLSLLFKLKNNPEIKHGKLRIVFTVCEEIELLGSKAMPKGWLSDMDLGVALDHSFPTDIVYCAPGKYKLKIYLQGRGGHASAPERKINAAHLATRVFARLPSGNLDELSTCNLGIINSGSAVNIIPSDAYAEYEIRSLSDDRLEFHKKRIMDIIKNTVEEGRIYPIGIDEERFATVKIERSHSAKPYSIAENSLPVRLMKKAIMKSGLVPIMKMGRGGSDANVLNNRGLVSCVIGCGMHGAHSVNESARIEEMEDCVSNLINLIGELK